MKNNPEKRLVVHVWAQLGDHPKHKCQTWVQGGDKHIRERAESMAEANRKTHDSTWRFWTEEEYI